MDSGASRNMPGMANNARSRDFTSAPTLSGAEDDRSSHSTLTQSFGTTGWGGSIWNNSLGAGFGSTMREGSRPRENSTYMGASSNGIEGKTGSGSLVASSESDAWNLNRSPWGSTTANMPHTRSSDVSPARNRSIAQAQPSQQFSDSSSSSFFPVPRGSTLTQGSVATPSRTLDPTTMNFISSRQNESTRQIDSLTNGFPNLSFSQTDANSQRPETAVGPWSDAASVHSPSDDRRSVAASEYFGPSSTTPSRSGSLPPSRHGEPVQYSQNTEHHPRYPQANPRQHSSFSFSNGRTFQERNGSIHSDSMQMLGRLSLEEDPHAGVLSHRPSLSINGLPPTFMQSGADGGFARDNYPETQALTRVDDSGYGNSRTYTPDSYTNGQPNDPNVQFRSFQFDSRSAPNGTAARQTPFYSNAHTPPVYDRLYPSRADQTLSNGTNLALVQSKLQGYQQQQEQRNYMNPAHYPPHHLQHVLAANNLRSSYGYAYPAHNNINMHNLAPNLPIQVVPGMVAMIEPPRGPRDHNQPSEAIMSKCLYQFKQDSKTNRRYELKDIYDHIVEFSGDQHGSRFIQQKLETANSDEKDRVFKEIQGDSLQLMKDVFGNYVIQKFFEHGDQTQKRILANRMRGNVVPLSIGMYGCRVVQKALEHVLTDQQALLVKELEKDVLNLVKDQNGNHVIQKAIERVPAEHIQFIIDAFRGNVASLSVHSYGCRVVQRLLEHCEGPSKRFIMEELHAEGSKLIADQYGNYVTQHVIEHGDSDDRATIIALVTRELFHFSKHKFASNVVEKCLIFGTDQQRHEIMLKIIEKNERGESNSFMLIKDNYGNYVIQQVLDMLSRKDYDELVAVLKPEIEKAKRTISGKQLIAVEKKLHRFDRIDSVASPQRSSMSSTDSSTEVPPLTSDAQSPQSSGLPSGNISTIDDPVHTRTPTANKTLSTPDMVSIANA